MFESIGRLGGGLARREFGSFPVGCSTLGRSSNSLGCLKTNFKKLTNDQEYKSVPYIMILQLFFSKSIFVWPTVKPLFHRQVLYFSTLSS